jgi:hypothetical protein
MRKNPWKVANVANQVMACCWLRLIVDLRCRQTVREWPWENVVLVRNSSFQNGRLLPVFDRPNRQASRPWAAPGTPCITNAPRWNLRRICQAREPSASRWTLTHINGDRRTTNKLKYIRSLLSPVARRFLCCGSRKKSSFLFFGYICVLYLPTQLIWIISCSSGLELISEARCGGDFYLGDSELWAWDVMIIFWRGILLWKTWMERQKK